MVINVKQALVRPAQLLEHQENAKRMPAMRAGTGIRLLQSVSTPPKFRDGRITIIGG